jgi:hypothetical protein
LHFKSVRAGLQDKVNHRVLGRQPANSGIGRRIPGKVAIAIADILEQPQIGEFNVKVASAEGKIGPLRRRILHAVT